MNHPDMIISVMIPAWVGALTGAVLGAIVGSFLATLVVRWPAGEAVTGRSRCDGCRRPIGAASLVPLLSFALLRGRCAVCGTAIDPRHPIVEALAAAIGGIAFVLAPGLPGFGGALFGWLLLALALLDFEHFWLPDRLTATLALTGLAFGLAGTPPVLIERLIGAVLGFGGLALIGFGYRRLRGRIGLGQGDPKLLGAIGLWLGWRALPLVLLAASLVGIAYALVCLLAGRRLAATDRLPLGTLLAVAAWLCWCAGAAGWLPPAFISTP